MTQAVNNILDAALNLSAEERAELATRLIRSLDGDAPSAEEQSAIDAAWREEIGRRIGEIDTGAVDLMDGDEFIAKLARRSGREAQP